MWPTASDILTILAKIGKPLPFAKVGNFFSDVLTKMWALKTVQRSALCRSRRELSNVPFSQSSFQIDPNSNEYFLAKFDKIWFQYSWRRALKPHNLILESPSDLIFQWYSHPEGRAKLIHVAVPAQAMGLHQTERFHLERCQLCSQFTCNENLPNLANVANNC